MPEQANRGLTPTDRQRRSVAEHGKLRLGQGHLVLQIGELIALGVLDRGVGFLQLGGHLLDIQIGREVCVIDQHGHPVVEHFAEAR